MRFVSTHVLARALDEAAVREAVRAGHVYVSHDWIADPTGFRFYLAGDGGEPAQLMGDEARVAPGCAHRGGPPAASAGSPAARRRRGGDGAARPTVSSTSRTSPASTAIEAWVEIGGEVRPWIYSNPIYLRGGAGTGAG